MRFTVVPRLLRGRSNSTSVRVFAFAMASLAAGAALSSLGCLPAQATSADDIAQSEHAWDETNEPGAPSTDAEGGRARLRVVAANITSGTRQSYDEGHGARILQALRPDVVLIQELNYGYDEPSDIRAFVDDTFGTDFHYFREEGGTIPNGVVSRYPIVESGQWEDPATSTRAFAWARIDIPGDVDLWAVSVHLLTSNSSDRRREADARSRRGITSSSAGTSTRHRVERALSDRSRRS